MSEATYRFENAKQGRAGCQNSACKKEAIKIGKGELRFGSLVTMRDYTSWMWKHWGCVTPKQIANIQNQIGDLEGLDLDNDLDDILDGFEDLTPESQEEIKYALRNGHVRDEVWKGDPELNRPGMTGINKRTPKKKANGEDASGSDAEHSTPSKPKKGSKKKATADDDGADEPAPKKKTSRKRKAGDEDEAEEVPVKKRGKSKKAAIKDEDVDTDMPVLEPPKKKSRAKKVKTEPEPEPESETEVAVLQNDGAADSDDVPVQAVKKRGRKSAVKEEEADEEPVAKPIKKGRAKKVKAEPEAEEDNREASVPSRRSSRNTKAKA